MLSSLKEKILNVKQNVPLFLGEEKDLKRKQAINPNAGGDILHHFQTQWEDMHKISESNAKKADQLAQEIEEISTKINASKENISLITHILTNSNLSTNITQCLNTIKDLYRLSDSIEMGLINLENLIDENEFENLKVQHQYHLSQYQLKKEQSLESFKSALDANHFKKIAEYEAKKKAIMEERQRVFQDAFRSDIQSYKNLGTLPEINQTRNQNSAMLEEIQLDFDQKELDQFFSDKL